MKIELIYDNKIVEFFVDIYNRTCYLNGSARVLSEQVFHPLVNTERLASLISRDLRRDLEKKFNQEFNAFIKTLSIRYLSSYIIMEYLLNTVQPYSKPIVISLEEVSSDSVKFSASREGSKIDSKKIHFAEDYNWLLGIKITDGSYQFKKWTFGSTKPELAAYTLTHFRVGKIRLMLVSIGNRKKKHMRFEVKTDSEKDLAVKLLESCRKVLENLSVTLDNQGNNNIEDIIDKVRPLVHESLRPLLEKYLSSRVDQVLVLSAILAGDGVRYNKGLRISYSLLRKSERGGSVFYVKGFVIDSILMYLCKNNIVRLNKYLLRVRDGKHEGQVYIDVNPEVAPLIPLFVPYGRGLSYMSMLFTTNYTWPVKSMRDLLGSEYVVSKLREVVNLIDYGYVACKRDRGHYYLVLRVRKDFIGSIVECLRAFGFNPQVYRSRPNEVRIFRGKEILAKMLLDCGKLHGVDECRHVLERWFRRLG